MQNAKPVDELLTALPAVGLHLNNLFQCEDGSWQANMRDASGGDFYDFGKGATPAAALIACLQKAGVEVSDDPA